MGTGGCSRTPHFSHSFRWACHAQPCKNPERRQRKLLTLMDKILYPWTSDKAAWKSVQARVSPAPENMLVEVETDLFLFVFFFFCLEVTFPFSSLQPFLSKQVYLQWFCMCFFVSFFAFLFWAFFHLGAWAYPVHILGSSEEILKTMPFLQY